MTTERKKALLYLAITFVLGLVIGALLPAFVGHMRHAGQPGRPKMDHRMHDNRKAWFEKRMFKVIQPDSTQAGELRKILRQTSEDIEALQSNSNAQMGQIMDSMRMRIKPLLNEEQRKRYDEFSEKARMRRQGGPEKK